MARGQSCEVIPLTWADAWLLHAIVVAGGGAAARLYDVIRAGDMINHAIFTVAELDGGATRLLAAGLISVQDKEFIPPRSVVELWQQLQSRSVTDAGECLRQHIGASRPGMVDPPDACDPRWRSGMITAEDVHLASIGG
jgi:hypothetical protein